MATIRLGSAFVGRVGEMNIYRVDLSQSGLSTINTITIKDDNILSGSPGNASGLDLDFVKLLNTATVDAASVPGISGEAVFDFGTAGVLFQPGFQRPLKPGDPPELNTNLRGTSGANIYDPNEATLDTMDINLLSLGEGGQVTFLLKNPVSTSGRYFYYADFGDPDLGDILVSDTATSPPPLNFTLIGTSGPDSIRLGVGANIHLGSTDTIVYGRGGNDRIHGAFGNDRLHGETGNDVLSGRGGADWINGGKGNDRVNGGEGNDRLTGGAHKDVFVFDSKLGNSKTDRTVNFDMITDFSVSNDSIWLDNAIFRKLGKGTISNPKQIEEEFLGIGARAREKDDYLVYNKKTGILSYDADGSGRGKAIEFAQLKKGLALTPEDIFII
jgi:Ca2+-binding RTX toxin-like protein